MGQAGHTCSWNISETYFRLITESIRLFSNRALRCASLSEVLDERAARARDIAQAYKAEDLKAHLSIIPTDGGVPVEVTILETSYDVIGSAIPKMEEVIGGSVSFAAAISLILFDLVFDESRTEFVTKLGLSIDEAKTYKSAGKKRGGKVVPIR